VSRYRTISALGAGTSGTRRGPHEKGHFPPLLSADGVLTPAQVCALRTPGSPCRCACTTAPGRMTGPAVLVTSAERARDLRPVPRTCCPACRTPGRTGASPS